jgi:hypothetical protein
MRKLAIAAAVGLALLVLGQPAKAQTQHQIALTVPVAANDINGHCYADISSETIDGQPFDISNVEAIESSVYNHCPTRTAGILVSLPPQPYFTIQDWVYIEPPYPSQVTRGAAVPLSCQGLQVPPNGTYFNYKYTFTGNCFQAVDTFNYADTHHNASWTGSLTRQFAQFNKCYRTSCTLVDEEVSNSMNATVTVN